MSDSILDSVKDKVGGGAIHEHFDGELIDYINSIFVILRQNGIGPENGFIISDANATWSDFLGDNLQMQSSVQSYVAMKVRLRFDPPTSTAVSQALKEEAAEDLWRLGVNYEVHC